MRSVIFAARGVKLMMMGAIVSLTVNESNVMSYVAKGGEGPTYQEAFVAITLSYLCSR